MTIKGSFILEHPHVKAVFGSKKSQSKLVPKMAVFRTFKGLNIKYSYRALQKALPYPERRTAKSRIWGTETPEPIDTKFCMPSAVHDVICTSGFRPPSWISSQMRRARSGVKKSSGAQPHSTAA